ncbi:RES domain-containing protein [Rathayibacter sp. PhB152]|uniref:RES family NAD+ phosphorylase n=1 Tax=Rathayibacter sp. PhB152 TaxID=2485190 RepID=UPI000F4BEB4A|nr:RES family NAD+ phosphorylase [Rathayibacter sp. PhB152]ROQ64759.1 RES domain-containing protein [Rathayibacter sp. PhB152]
MSRAEVAQQGPSADQDLTAFPAVEPEPEWRWRAHSTELAAWWFSTSGRGRFDLPDSGADGTCYVADDVRTAVRESLGDRVVPDQVITPAAAAAFRVSAVRPPPGLTCAAVTSQSADQHGVTRELTTMTDYDVTQAWAAALHAAGFDGIRYSSRYTSAAGPNSWALFAPKGGNDDFAVDAARELDGPAACAQAGVRVLEPPPLKRAVTLLTGPPR